MCRPMERAEGQAWPLCGSRRNALWEESQPLGDSEQSLSEKLPASFMHLKQLSSQIDAYFVPPNPNP